MNTNLMKENINFGLEFLRMILSFWVLIHHCCPIKNQIILNYFFIKSYHVPTFVIISFYFFYKTISKNNINKINQRFERLCIPYFIWPLIIWVINNILYYINMSAFNRRFDLKELSLS